MLLILIIKKKKSSLQQWWNTQHTDEILAAPWYVHSSWSNWAAAQSSMRTAQIVRGHTVMTAGLKGGGGWVLFGGIKFKNKVSNWPWNWAEWKPSTSQLGHCVLVHEFPTEFASNLCWSWMIFQGWNRKGSWGSSRGGWHDSLLCRYQRKLLCCFGLNPNFIFAGRNARWFIKSSLALVAAVSW